MESDNDVLHEPDGRFPSIMNAMTRFARPNDSATGGDSRTGLAIGGNELHQAHNPFTRFDFVGKIHAETRGAEVGRRDLDLETPAPGIDSKDADVQIVVDPGPGAPLGTFERVCPWISRSLIHMELRVVSGRLPPTPVCFLRSLSRPTRLASP
jgi:hypothetical protein